MKEMKRALRALLMVLCLAMMVGACTNEEAPKDEKVEPTTSEEPKKEEPKTEESKKEEPKKEEPKSEEPKEKLKESKFTEEDGMFVFTDLENSPYEGMGLKIVVEKGETGKAKFVKTDMEGNEDVNYFIFDYSSNTFEKYNYVSAMGSGYYYYYDLAAKELTKVENNDHEDTTEGLKAAGRWDGAVASTEEDIVALEKYFEAQHGTTIEEFVKK